MRVLELANDQTANRGEQLGHSYNVLRYGKLSYNRGSVDGHGKSYNVRMGVVFEDPSNLDTPVERIKDNKSLDSELKNQDKSKSHIRRLRIEKGRTVEPAGLGMSFDCFNGDWKWHTTVTINKALINQMRLDILVGNQLKDEIYEPFELLDPDQRLEGSYDVQTIEGKVWRNLCWITSRVTLERARNIFDSNYLEENWEVFCKIFFARDQLENGRDIEGERVEVSRMKRMRMEVKTTYIYKAMNVTKRSSQEMGLAKVDKKGLEQDKDSTRIKGQKSRRYRIKRLRTTRKKRSRAEEQDREAVNRGVRNKRTVRRKALV
ncbi:hypothetical protein PPACK8108_LOCUS111 [Phakopsora pachyrhizi]|uniref:Uncharacterized protein n=1 Tax=Phakopsora pachyrhizi TaxID=170000 RepID=A0AAV0AFG4_PHAPC|nr:hypothetical protein PPACK8108_LOCUS111 [Phakopsora pachyrhizi]